MKKLLFVLIAIMLSYNTFAETDSTSITTAERIIDKYTTKMFDVVQSTAQALEQPAKEIFKSVVKLQVAKGFINLLPILVFIIAIMMFYKEYRRVEKILSEDRVPCSYNKHQGPMEDANITPIAVISLIIAVLFIIIGIFTVPKGIQYLASPEWFGIKEVLSIFK